MPAARAAVSIAWDRSGSRSRAMTRYGLPVSSLAASAPLAATSSSSWAVRKSTISWRSVAVMNCDETTRRSRVTLAARTIVPLRS